MSSSTTSRFPSTSTTAHSSAAAAAAAAAALPGSRQETCSNLQNDAAALRAKPHAINSRFQRLLAKRDEHSARRRLTLARPGVADFSSNDFLSLSTSQLLRDAYLGEFTSPATKELGLGSGGSRLLDGNSSYAEALECDIAAFHGAEAGLLFNSGFDANSGLFSCLPQADDVVVYDEFIHASVHEGMRLSRAYAAQRARSSPSFSSSSTSSSSSSSSSGAGEGDGQGGCYAFKHNDLAHFENLLARIITVTHHPSSQLALDKDSSRHLFVAVEAVYSMDGDVAPLEQLLDLIDKYLPLGNGHLIVDEAHSTGVYGDMGRGVVCTLGLEKRIFARLHTFGKALASGGAIVLCSATLREYLVNYARSLIYTTMMGLPNLVVIRAVYGLMMSGATIRLQTELWSLVGYLHKSLLTRLDVGDTQTDADTSRRNGDNEAVLRISIGKPQSPIFSLLTARPRSLAARCQERGYMARPIVAPTVPVGAERVRVCLHAGNTRAEIDGLVKVISEWVDEQAQQQQHLEEQQQNKKAGVRGYSHDAHAPVTPAALALSIASKL